jgi:hypothetical protein
MQNDKNKHMNININNKEKIIKSQKYFCNFLNTDIINSLIHLFTMNDKKSNIPNIINYIEDERVLRGLNNNITIESYLYGENKNNSTLILSIKKDEIEILHFSIHLCVRSLNSNKSGIIHFYKNIYKNIYKPVKENKNKNKNTKKIPKTLYVLIKIEQPINYSKSLVFSIIDNSIPGIYDNELQKEMDVIITVLNRLFDETDDKYYIGNKNYYINNDNYYINNKQLHLHNKTNNVLKNINKYNKHVTRKNKGFRIFPVINNKKDRFISYNVSPKNKYKKTLRKIHIINTKTRKHLKSKPKPKPK